MNYAEIITENEDKEAQSEVEIIPENNTKQSVIFALAILGVVSVSIIAVVRRCHKKPMIESRLDSIENTDGLHQSEPNVANSNVIPFNEKEYKESPPITPPESPATPEIQSTQGEEDNHVKVVDRVFPVDSGKLGEMILKKESSKYDVETGLPIPKTAKVKPEKSGETVKKPKSSKTMHKGTQTTEDKSGKDSAEV